jgi:hypothetical protein
MSFNKKDCINPHQHQDEPSPAKHTSNSNNVKVEKDLNAEYDWRTTDEFIQRIVSEITINQSLAFTLPKTRIPQIVERVAKYWFRRAEIATEERWYIIRNQDISGNLNRTIKLPKQIISVADVRLTENAYSAFAPANFRIERLLANSVSFYTVDTGQFNYAGPVMSTGLSSTAEYFMGLMEIKQLESLLFDDVRFDHNPLSGTLTILGDSKGCDLILLTYTRIKLQDLFNDDRFLMHCVGECMSNISFILSALEFKMPGGVTINKQQWSSEGKAMIAEVKESLANDVGGDIFYVLGN